MLERLLPPQDWKIGAQVKPDMAPRAISRLYEFTVGALRYSARMSLRCQE